MQSLFFSTPADRLALVRQRYFEEGKLPSGAVTTVVRVKGVEHALQVANDSAYGLSLAVFGRDVTRALGVAMRMECGSAHINGSTVQNEAQAPYGGTKDSGYGKFDGRTVIDEFTELKWITIEPSVQDYPV